MSLPPLIPAPSPNFNERLHPLDMLVLHYTGMKTGEEALARLREDAEPRVSAHYMVEEDGRIFAIVRTPPDAPLSSRALPGGRNCMCQSD